MESENHRLESISEKKREVDLEDHTEIKAGRIKATRDRGRRRKAAGALGILMNTLTCMIIKIT